MKFTHSLIVNQPLSRVVELADNPANIKQWQPQLTSISLLSGTARQPGATSKLVYDMKGRPLEMTETIVSRALPREITSKLESKGMVNTIRTYFEPLNATSTKMSIDSDFQFSGVMRLMGSMMFGQLKKQSLTYLYNFKDFAEKQ